MRTTIDSCYTGKPEPQPSPENPITQAQLEYAVGAERLRCYEIVMDLPLLGGDAPDRESYWDQKSKSFAFEASRLIREPVLEADWRAKNMQRRARSAA